jgi:hypothetical protein
LLTVGQSERLNGWVSRRETAGRKQARRTSG